MKLIRRMTLSYLLLLLPLLLLGGAMTYWLISNALSVEADEALFKFKTRVEQRIADGKMDFDLIASDKQVSLQRTYKQLKDPVFSDTLLYDKDEEEFIPWRNMRFSARSPHNLWLVEIRQSMLESEDLLETISQSVIVLFAALLLSVWLLNRFLSKRIWKPFEETLATINHFSLQSDEPLNFSPAKTYEFRLLNETLKGFTQKLRYDYLAQKRFTEQAAHEMQTPLAILRTKLELLIQSDGMKKEEAALVQDLFSASDRLSRLLKNMLLLARIGNQQYNETSEINWKRLVEEQKELYQEFIQEKKLLVVITIKATPRLRMHPVLAEVIISNLFRNAIQHNVQGGTVTINLSDNEMIFQNSGMTLSVDPEMLFGKFVKGDPSQSGSNGLGLAIVKESLEQSDWNIFYKIKNGSHTIAIIEN